MGACAIEALEDRLCLSAAGGGFTVVVSFGGGGSAVVVTSGHHHHHHHHAAHHHRHHRSTKLHGLGDGVPNMGVISSPSRDGLRSGTGSGDIGSPLPDPSIPLPNPVSLGAFR